MWIRNDHFLCLTGIIGEIQLNVHAVNLKQEVRYDSCTVHNAVVEFKVTR